MSQLNGNWNVDLKFIHGEARHAMHLEQEGDALKGRYRALYGEHELRGRVQDGVVKIQVGIHYQGVGTTYSFEGKVEGGTMQGEVDLGEYWSATWEAQQVDS